MKNHAHSGWAALLSQPRPFSGEGRYPVAAYSEFMPGPLVGLKPYGWVDPFFYSPADNHGFLVSEYEQAHQLRAGLVRIAQRLCGELRKLAEGQQAFSRNLLLANPYWPEALAGRAGSRRSPGHERHLVIVPLSLSRTMDDKGRVRWTLFGSSEQGPARPFWNSFRSAPDRELPEDQALLLVRRLLSLGCGAQEDLQDLRRAGFRILPAGPDPDFPFWEDEGLPGWAQAYLLGDGEAHAPDGVRYLLTFRPFARLPQAVQQAYLQGALQLLPFPGSLVFFGHGGYRRLARKLPLAMQVPLLHLFPRDRAAATGIRIPQSGWIEEPRPGGNDKGGVHGHGPVVNQIKRTHRWNRTHRDQDEVAVLPGEERVAHALFSNDPELLGLYDKPMARNAQLWTGDYNLLLDGPHQGRQRIDEAARALADGGHFGYRFLFPPMRVGAHEVYWQLPLCAAFSTGAAAGASDEGPELLPAVLPDSLPGGLTGYLAAYPRWDPEAVAAPITLWPRLERREPHLAAAELFERDPGHRLHTTAYNVRKLLDAYERLGEGVLRRSLARRLLTVPRECTFAAWLDSLPGRAADPERARRLMDVLQERVQGEDPPLPVDPQTRLPRSLTLAETSSRDFEERYFAAIAELAEGRFVHKDNADQAGPGVDHRAPCDLPALGDFLRGRHEELIARHGMTGKALVTNHWFRWRTEFDYPWSGGWARNQTGHARERNLVVIIPGQDRSEAVIMADHYDTAYMEDVYDKERGGDHTRRAAQGADDNHSATAALLMAADVLLPLSRAGKLRRDVWLVHLTGEEFPADCLGARNLVQRLVEGTLSLECAEQGFIDVSAVRVRGAYILDMVAHNNDHERYVFQISPGEGAGSMRLAYHAHLANERWNHSTPIWNQAPERREPGPSQRMESGAVPPPVVAHPCLAGEVRPGWHFRSSLYNTDAQILSDAGIPVVLFMEDYDINRTGYHDTQDTMKNIDLDYGAALVAIAIESVASVATEEDP